ncbi:MAG TPA: hypothetical protein VNO30_19970 [Kofleriaceae bacterium]|nr:hypothetical protein [Kofleriaceae bacterium]
MSWLRRTALAAMAVGLLGVLGCSSVSTVRVQPDNLYAGPRMRPIAVIHAQVTSAYLLFIPIPGHVDLDRVVNRMLLATAKTLGADKVVNIRIDITPDGGIWTLRKLLGWRTAEASGVAVVIEDGPPLPGPGGPEAPAGPAAAGGPSGSPGPAGSAGRAP